MILSMKIMFKKQINKINYKDIKIIIIPKGINTIIYIEKIILMHKMLNYLTIKECLKINNKKIKKKIINNNHKDNKIME